jgi:hypothetical protein
MAARPWFVSGPFSVASQAQNRTAWSTHFGITDKLAEGTSHQRLLACLALLDGFWYRSPQRLHRCEALSNNECETFVKSVVGKNIEFRLRKLAIILELSGFVRLGTSKKQAHCFRL